MSFSPLRLASIVALWWTSGCFDPSTADGGTGGVTEGTGSSSVDASATAGDAPATSSGPSTIDDGPASTGEPPDPSGTTDAADDTTGAPPPTCNQVTHTCLAAPPADWTGPVLVLEGDADAIPQCAGSYSEVVADVDVAPTGAPADCSCTCGAAQGVTCNTTSAHCPGTNCTAIFPTPCTLTALPNLSCVNITDTTYDWWSLTSIPSGGTCTPQEEQSVPEPVFETHIRVCGARATEDGCEVGEVCAPIPAAPLPNTFCIYREGEHVCPEGPFSERILHYRDFEDTRSCGPECTCGEPDGECSGAGLNLYSTDTCAFETAPGSGSLSMEGCDDAALSSTIRGIRRTGTATFSGSCPASGFTAVGEVTPADPVTACCIP